MTIALFHFHVTQIKRSTGQSAVAAAAYRSGEKLHSEYYGEDSDYTRKGGVICSEILLPAHAPQEYADRETLWNAVEKVERGKKAQLAYSFDIALQNEFSMEENINLARQFLLEQFVRRGMIVDFAVHSPDKEDGGISNPHFHVMCPIRPIEPNGKWGNKQRREYVLDEDGNRIPDGTGDYVFNAVPTTDWGSPETLEHWRQTWAELCYQLSHIRNGKSHIQKSLAVWKPELERYTGLVQQIKKKSKERKALVAEKKELPIYHVKRHKALAVRIAELTEDLEELRSENSLLLCFCQLISIYFFHFFFQKFFTITKYSSPEYDIFYHFSMLICVYCITKHSFKFSNGNMKFFFSLISPSKIIGIAPLMPFNSPFNDNSPKII